MNMTATSEEVVDELKEWREMYLRSELLFDLREVRYLTKVINALEKTEFVRPPTILEWVDWLNQISWAYSSRGLKSAAKIIGNWE